MRQEKFLFSTAAGKIHRGHPRIRYGKRSDLADTIFRVNHDHTMIKLIRG